MDTMKDEAGTTDFELPPPEREGGWMKVPATPYATTGRIWHYTDAGGTIGILKSNQIWATSITALNDSQEFAYGVGLLEAQLSLMTESRNVHPLQKSFVSDVVAAAITKDEQSNLFIACASEEKDSLGQWQVYGGSIGYAIGLDVNFQYFSVLDESAEPQQSPRNTLMPQWRKVVYSPAEQTRFILECLAFCAYITPAPDSEDDWGHTIARESAIGHILQMLSYLKHPSFHAEKEVRLVASAPPQGDAIKFRASKYGITPYIRMTTGIPWGEASPTWTVREHLPLPVAELRVGPTSYAESAAAGAERLLSAVGRRGTPITASAAPWR